MPWRRLLTSLTALLALGTLSAQELPLAGSGIPGPDLEAGKLQQKDSQAGRTDQVELPDPQSYRPRIALILSGGGARGLAQIGILAELERAGIVPDYIIGTSMGAIIGGLYAAGYSARELDSLVTGAPWEKILTTGSERDRSDQFLDMKHDADRSLFTLRFQNFSFIVPEAISAGHRLTEFLNGLVWNAPYHTNGDFDRLRYRFRAIATNLVDGTTVSLRRGDLVTAMRASATVPLRFAPVKLDSMILVDGGLLANIPVEAAREFAPDIIVAVNTTSPLLDSDKLKTPWNVADQAVTVMIRQRSEVERQLADFLIEPDLGSHPAADFSNLDTLIDAGRHAARQVIPGLKSRIRLCRDSLLHSNHLLPLAALPEKWRYSAVALSGFNTGDSLAFIGDDCLSSTDNALFCSDNIARLAQYQKVALMGVDGSGSSNSLRLLRMTATPYPAIGRLKFNGVAPANLPLLNKIGERFVGRQFDGECVHELREAIVRSYRRQGYSLAEVTQIVQEANGDVLVSCREGIIASIVVQGNESSTHLFVRRELEMTAGQPFDAATALRGWKSLINTEIFSNVTIETRLADHSDNIDVLVNVRERGSQIVRLGLRVDDERNTQLGLDLAEENLFGLGLRSSLRLAGGLRNQYSRFTLMAPRFFDTFWTGRVDGYYARDKSRIYGPRVESGTNTYDRLRDGDEIYERYGIMTSIGRQIEKTGKLIGQFRYELQRNYRDDRESTAPEFERIATFKIGLDFDSRDRIEYASTGRVVHLSFESSILNLRNDVKFARAILGYEEYFGLGAHTLHPKLQFGFADLTAPRPELFSIGGQQQFYGMREDEERGTQLALASLEYRLKSPVEVFFDTYLSARYNIGSTWDKPTQIRISQLKHGIGFGVGLNTPIGPADFSLGRAFFFTRNPDRVIFGPLLAYFSIGMPI